MSQSDSVALAFIGASFGRKFVGPEEAGQLISNSLRSALQAAIDRAFLEAIRQYLSESGQNLNFVEVNGNLWTVTNNGGPLVVPFSNDCEKLHKKKLLDLATEMGLSTVTEGPDYDRIIATTKDWAKLIEDEDEDDEEEQGN